MEKTLRILILEDNPVDADLVQFELEEAGIAFTAKVVVTESDFIREIEAFSPEIILADYDLPRYSGAAALAEAKRRCPNVPFILVTGAVSEERAIEILTSGAKDYVMKRRLIRLAPAVRRALAEAEVMRARRQAEEELREAHAELAFQVEKRTAELQAVLDTAPIAIWIAHDPLGREITRNAYAKQILGMASTDEAAGTFQVFRDGVVVRPEESPARAAAATGQPVANTELEMVFSDGRRVHLIKGAVPLFDAAGCVRGAVATGLDITRRKEEEIALRQSEERQRLVLQASAMGTFEVHLQTGETHWNDTEFELLGLKPGAAPENPETFFRFVHPDDAGRLRGQWEEALRTGKLDAEFRIVRADGRERWLAAKGRFIFAGQPGGGDPEAGGRALRFTGVNFDITARKQAEEALRRNNERLEILSATAGRLLASDQPQQLVEELCTRVMRFLDCDAFFNFIVDEGAGRLHLNACAGIPAETAREIEWLDFGVAVCGCAARDACRIVAEHIPETPDIRTELVKSFGIRAYACHPLLEGERVIGTLSFGTRSRDSFSEDDLAMMKTVADQVAVAMSRVQAKEALRQSQEAYRHLVEGSGSVILRVDGEMRITYINRYGLQFFGYSPEEIIGKPALGTIVPDRDESDQDLASMTADILSHPENFATNVHQNRCKDGRLVWMSWANKPVYDGRGRLVEILAVGNDLSKLKQAEEALRQSREQAQGYAEQLRSTLDAAPAIIWTAHDRDCRTITGNRAAHEFSRVSAEVNLSKTGSEAERLAHYRVFHEGVELQPEEMPLQVVARTGRELLDYSIDFHFADGSARTATGNVIPVRDAQGHPAGAIAAFLETTERRRAEAALQGSEQRLRALVEASSDVLYRMSPDWSEMRQLDGGEFLAATERPNPAWLQKYIHPDDRPRVMEAIQEAIRTKGIFELEHRVRRTDGSLGWTLSRAVPLLDAKGEIVEWFGAATDITPRKQAEDECLRCSARLAAAGKKPESRG